MNNYSNFNNSNYNQANQEFNYDINLRNNISGNSRKILYLTVAVAALFVAVLSGTFAYFTASATNTTAVGGNIATISAGELAVDKLEPTTAAANGTNLIPLDTTNSTSLTTDTTRVAALNSALDHNCIDDNGYTACHVYQVQVGAAANAPRTRIYGTFNITYTGTNTNLNYTIIKKQVNSGSTTKGGSANKPSLTSLFSTAMSSTYYTYKVSAGNNLKFTEIEPGTYTSASVGNAFIGSGSASVIYYQYYIVVWLEDTNSDQTSADSGKSYTGTVTISTGAEGNNQITATFSS